MVIRYIVIDRGGGEFIPVAEADGVEIYRGSIFRSENLAFHAAVNCKQVEMVRSGVPVSAVAR